MVDLSKISAKVQKSLTKKGATPTPIYAGTEMAEVSTNPEDYVVLPSWWKDAYGILGLQFGRFVQVAGDSDTGKTSLALLAMKHAQQQGCLVLYVETEGKTSLNDLTASGIDPSKILLIQSNVTEEAYTIAFEALDEIYKESPTQKILFVFDSYGNTVSLHDEDLDMTEGSSKPGGHAKTNRLGIGKLSIRMKKQQISALIINYVYANMGSVGKTNAGGNALNFHSTLTIQTSRKGWLTATVKGKTVRKGAKVVWTSYKNHYARGLSDNEGKKMLLPAKIELDITADGFRPCDQGEGDDE